MDWHELLLYILEGLMSLILTIISVYLIPYLINKFAKDKDKVMLLALNDLVSTCVKSVYQTYVEALKGTQKWTAEAQKEALDKCYNQIMETASSELKSWLEKNQTNIETFIKSQIESMIYSLKNTTK